MKSKKYNILLINVHGLFRGHDLQLGVDSDTGGQTKYVLEYAENLAKNKNINQVTVAARLLKDDFLSDDYAMEEEKVNKKLSVLRVPCGDDLYLKKEKLWPYLDEFADNLIKKTEERGIRYDLIHSHYADAGYVAKRLSEAWSVPFIHTGHSLGMQKKQKLLENGLTEEDINREYNMDKRLEVENSVIESAALIITSTGQEITEQYGVYPSFQEKKFSIIAPGVDLSRFSPYYYYEDKKASGREDFDTYMQAKASIRYELNRFLTSPEKPLILTICRPEKRKNIEGLITAYGLDKELQSMANLAVFAGIRKDINEKDENEQKILIDMLLLMDKYDLYGKLAIPKKHDVEHEIPALYRYAAYLKGVFVNTAYIEPFGLTLIEAASSGLPVVTTNSGGPKDIISRCENGILVDVSDPEEISDALRSILIDSDYWYNLSNNGIKNVKAYYSWDRHTEELFKVLKERSILNGNSGKSGGHPLYERLRGTNRMIITDIDNTLVGDRDSLNEFVKWYQEREDRVSFTVATGRNIESTIGILQVNGVPLPDVFITSVGTEIYYNYKEQIIPDDDWREKLNLNWNPDYIKELLGKLPYLTLQLDLREYKISYLINDYTPEKLEEIHNVLRGNDVRYNLVLTEFSLLDILPENASKFEASRFVLNKFQVDERNIIACGDAGNDEEMLTGFPYSVIVANHQEELKGLKNVYYSQESYAAAIMDGLKYYHFLEDL